VSADHDIERWLAENGFGLQQARLSARTALEEAGLTRPGKQRISAQKLPRVRKVLQERFVLHCAEPACSGYAAGTGREAVLCDPKSACERCGGSANARAEAALLESAGRHGLRRLVVVGGSPSVREELERSLGADIELRMIDGTERRTQDRARSDLEWADLVLVWGASELHHKVSWLYTQGPPQQRRKVVHVTRRGVAALLAAAVEHLEKGSPS
jgi:hypothetical protein